MVYFEFIHDSTDRLTTGTYIQDILSTKKLFPEF